MSQVQKKYYHRRRRVAAALYLSMDDSKKNTNSNDERCWVRPILQLRKEQGYYHNLVAEMQLNDPNKYFNFFRMLPGTFDLLLSKVGPSLQKTEFLREVISPGERLSLTLRYLASGDSMVSLSYQYRIGKSTVSEIIPDTCKAIWESLVLNVLPVPTTERWLEIAQEFEQQWNFPHCIGAVDGKHIVIQSPPHAGSFYNYKGTHSIVLMAMCDANYRFILVDIGAQGRQSDGGIFRQSRMGQKFASGSFNLPPSEPLTEGGLPVPYVFVADEAFQLTTYSMRPYPRRVAQTIEHKIFNYRLSRARRMVECSFGILAAKWRIFRKPIIAKVETTELMVKAALCLHNFLLINEGVSTNTASLQHTLVNEVTSNLLELDNADGGNSHSTNASAIRERFKEYFNNTGAVPWQQDRVNNDDFY